MGHFLLAQARGGVPPMTQLYVIDTSGLWKGPTPGSMTLIKSGTWTEVTSPLGAPNVLYLDALDSSGELWLSTDAGVTWSDLTGSLPTTDGFFQRCMVQDGSGATVYIGDDNFVGSFQVARIWESTDFGATWSVAEYASTDHNSDMSDFDYKHGPIVWIAQMAIAAPFQNPFILDANPAPGGGGAGGVNYTIQNKLRGSDYVLYGPLPITYTDIAGIADLSEPSTTTRPYMSRRNLTDDFDIVDFQIPSVIRALATLNRCRGSQAILVTDTTMISIFTTEFFHFDGTNYVLIGIEIDFFLETVGGSPVNTLTITATEPTTLWGGTPNHRNYLFQDPLHPLICWAYIADGTLYQTTDGGATWSLQTMTGPTGSHKFVMVSG